MKKHISSTIALALICISNLSQAQIRTNNTISQTIAGESAFIDASSTVFSGTSNNSNGKGLVFPRTNLTTFQFAKASGTIASFPTAYDGMIVYNTTAGNTPTGGVSGIGGQAVLPGFYYFSNPGKGSTGVGGDNTYSSALGKWMPFTPTATSPIVNIGTAEVATNTQIAGAQVYAVKGTFAANGTSTSITLPTLGSNGSLYSITIFKKSATGNGARKVYAKDLYSYDPTTGAAVTGSPSISVVYPQDTYDYVMEYMKN